MPVSDEIVPAMQEIGEMQNDLDEAHEMASEIEQVQQWRDTRFSKAVDKLSDSFTAYESWDEHQLVDAFNQICDILKIRETIGEKSNPVVEIEKLPASATKQELLQALLMADEALDSICDAMSLLLEDENCTELDSAIHFTFFKLQSCLLKLKMKLIQDCPCF